MTPSPYKIFCIGVIWFIYTLITFIRFLKYKIRGLIHFINFSKIHFNDILSFYYDFIRN